MKKIELLKARLKIYGMLSEILTHVYEEETAPRAYRTLSDEQEPNYSFCTLIKQAAIPRHNPDIFVNKKPLHECLPELFQAKLELDDAFYYVSIFKEVSYWFPPSAFRIRKECVERAKELVEKKIKKLKPKGQWELLDMTATHCTFQTNREPLSSLKQAHIDLSIDLRYISNGAMEYWDKDIVLEMIFKKLKTIKFKNHEQRT